MGSRKERRVFFAPWSVRRLRVRGWDCCSRNCGGVSFSVSWRERGKGYHFAEALLAELLVHGGDALAVLGVLPHGVGISLELLGRSLGLRRGVSALARRPVGRRSHL